MTNIQKATILRHLQETILHGEPGALEKPVREAIEGGISAQEILGVVTKVMDRAGEMWDRLEIYLPDVVRIGEKTKECLKTLKPFLKVTGQSEISLGKVVLGTVEGDIHDIGRNVVGTMLGVNGFEVIDLGHNVAADLFIEKAEEIEADLIGLSALMTTSMPFQEDVLTLLNDRGLNEKYKVMVGGGPVTVDWTKEIGADGYGRTAIDAVRVAKRLMKGEVDPDGVVLEGGLL